VGISAPCILGMAITAPLLLPAATAADDKSVSATRTAKPAPAAATAGTVLRCSISLADGAASLSTAGPDVPKLVQPHASCFIAPLQAATNRTQRSSSTSPAPRSSRALQQPLPKNMDTSAAASGHDGSPPPRKQSRGHMRPPPEQPSLPSVAAVTGAGRDLLGFLTDPAQLDACLQLGVVKPTAGCQLPVAVDAAPVPLSEQRPGSERCSSCQHSSFAVFHEHDSNSVADSHDAASHSDTAARTAAATMQSHDTHAAAASLQGLRTKPAGFGSRIAHHAATDRQAAAAAPLRVSSSLYHVAWEVAAASPPSMPASPSVLHRPSLNLALRTDSSSITLQSHRNLGALSHRQPVAQCLSTHACRDLYSVLRYFSEVMISVVCGAVQMSTSRSSPWKPPKRLRSALHPSWPL